MRTTVICALRGRNPDNPSERKRSKGRYRQRLEVGTEGISNTLTSVEKDNYLMEMENMMTGELEANRELIKKFLGNDLDTLRKRYKHLDGWTADAMIRAELEAAMKPRLRPTARPEGKGWVWDDEKGKWFRVRKLTNRECFRLMDVSETDIDKIQAAGISKSQQYKMAGNSIVVACLAGIFGNLFDTTERIKTTLF